MSLTQQIESRIQSFVAELNELVRRQALQAVADALGTAGGGVAPRRGPGRPRLSNGAGGEAVATRGARARARRKGEKRTPAELAALERALSEHVRANPGQGIEAIGKALAMPTSELTRPMKKLIERREVRTQGAKRATKYFGSEGASGPGEESEGDGNPGRKRGARRSAKKRSKKKG